MHSSEQVTKAKKCCYPQCTDGGARADRLFLITVTKLVIFSDPCWSKFLPSGGLLLVWGQIPGRQSGAQDTISLQLAVLTEAARWGSFLGISNSCVLTQVIKGLLDFTSDMLQACAAHRGKSVISDTLWALCHRGTLLIHTESREWGLENSQDVLIKSSVFLEYTSKLSDFDLKVN